MRPLKNNNHQEACNSQQIIALCDLLEEPDFRQLADVDTPSGNYETRDVLSSSAVENGLSALNISDVSAITTVERTKGHHQNLSSIQEDPQSLSNTLTFRCDTCGMVFKTSAALHKHQVCAFIRVSNA